MDLYKKLQHNRFIIAGPCVLEDQDTLFRIAESVAKSCEKYSFTYIFKASFDKANRTSINSFRGEGLEKGLEQLEKVKNKFNVPLTTDIHESYQADLVKDVVDIIQIPAFLCRQTDLLLAAGKTDRVVNIKKAQFLSGESMINPVKKVMKTGNCKILLTERGSMYGFNQLVVDYTGMMDMIDIKFPVVFDATHSVQKPGSLGTATGGNREYAPKLAYAAASIGVKGFFFEVHPNPVKALSDGANSLELENFERVVGRLAEFANAYDKIN